MEEKSLFASDILELDRLIEDLASVSPKISLRRTKRRPITARINAGFFNEDESDSNRDSQLVRNVTATSCGVCKGTLLTSSDRVTSNVSLSSYHMKCFKCNKCQCALKSRYFERDGLLYCPKDFHEAFSPKCAYCQECIEENCISALGKTWHVDHLFCAQCGEQLSFRTETLNMPQGIPGFYEIEGKAYCEKDYALLFATLCGGCNQPIVEGNYMRALDHSWHELCFCCFDCHEPFQNSEFYDSPTLVGKLLCLHHYHERSGTLCRGCNKGIAGSCINVLGGKYHPTCFKCFKCRTTLVSLFHEKDKTPYCNRCFNSET